MRSDSKPGYFRPSSKGNYVRDNSSFRRNSNVRARLMPGDKFTRPSRNDSKPGGRGQSKTPQRHKSELFKRVEYLEKDNKDIKNLQRSSKK